MANEALDCFTSLLDTVPAWIADLETILKSAVESQEEATFACPPADSHTFSAKEKPKSKSSSLKSKRSTDDKEEDVASRRKLGFLKRPTLQHLTNSDALRLSQRKRKTASVYSGDESGPPKFRTKAAAVVFYDGDTQKRFEKLVRQVGSSRNSIRKGKMSAKVDALSRCGSSASDSGSGGEGDDFDPFTAQLSWKARRPTRPAFGRGDNSEAFDRVDGRLEKGQALIERAAHQILRDGDCTVEVTNAKEHFSEALKMAEAELPALRRKADKAAERRRRSEERRRVEEEEEAQRQTIRDAVEAVTAPHPSEGDLEVDALEVDDSTDDEPDRNSFDISAFSKIAQMRSTREMRSTRLAAH